MDPGPSFLTDYGLIISLVSIVTSHGMKLGMPDSLAGVNQLRWHSPVGPLIQIETVLVLKVVGTE